MGQPEKTLRFKVEVRDPYMGNWIPVKIAVHIKDGEITYLWVVNPEGIAIQATRVNSFND